MAVLESNQTVSNNRNGFDKEISKSARTMMLDNIQNFIYQKPIPSCVRETVSNCIDATNEKLVAIRILNGEVNVKDVYKTLDDVEVAKEGDNIYEDSEFKPEYYDPKWLSSSNKISIVYKSNTIVGERDMFSITDNGVGIGGARLEGIFSLGFSTKRLNTNELGGFGIGQKSALATGVSSYRMLTRHNGKEFMFDIFSHKVENVHGKWNAETGEANPYIEFDNTWVDSGKTEEVMDRDGNFVTSPIMEKFKAYYIPTKEKNGTTIEFEVKSHNKPQFIEAVKSQLMYLKDDITFTVIDQYGTRMDVPFKAAPIYEDDNIILSNYGYYNRPHFVIKGIAYGMIDFAEAELSPKFGNMGFKFKMEDLDVLPSREGVRYTPRTTAAIVAIYDKNKATVTKMISDELKETKFYPWLQSATKVANRTGNGNSQDVLARLSSLSDLSDLDLKFNNTNIKYNSSFKEVFTPILGLQSISQRGSTIERKDIDYISSFTAKTYFQFKASNNKTSAYLLVGSPEYTVLRTATAFRYLSPVFENLVANKYPTDDLFLADAAQLIIENETDEVKRKNVTDQLKKALKMMRLLTADKLIKSYDDVIVPESFNVGNTTENDFNEKMQEARYKEILKERRANKEFYIQTFVVKSTWTNESKLSRKLVKFAELDTRKSNGCELVYFTEDTDPKLIAAITDISIDDQSKRFNNDKLLVFKVAKSNLNQVKNLAVKLEDWFFNIDEEGTLSLTDMVKDIVVQETSYKLKSWMINHSKIINEGFHKKVTKLSSAAKKAGAFRCNTPGFLMQILEVNKQALLLDNDYENEDLSKAVAKLNTDIGFPKDVIKVDILDAKSLRVSEEIKDFERVYGSFLNAINIPKCKEEIEIVLQAKKDQLQFKFKGLHDDSNS